MIGAIFSLPHIAHCKEIYDFFPADNKPEAGAGMWYHKTKGPDFPDYFIGTKTENDIWEPICPAYNNNDIMGLLRAARGLNG